MSEIITSSLHRVLNWHVFLHLYLLFYSRGYGQSSRYTATWVPLFCQNVFGDNNHIGIWLWIFFATSQRILKFVACFRLSWPIGYWGTLSGDLLGGGVFQRILLIIMYNFSHLLMNSMSHIFAKAIYWKSINWALWPRLFWGNLSLCGYYKFVTVCHIWNLLSYHSLSGSYKLLYKRCV